MTSFRKDCDRVGIVPGRTTPDTVRAVRLTGVLAVVMLCLTGLMASVQKSSAVSQCGMTDGWAGGVLRHVQCTGGHGESFGDLNGNIWGVSRGGDQNPPQGIYNAVAHRLPMWRSFGRLAGAHLQRAIGEHGGRADGCLVLAMYRSNVRFAGRTGTISFDVSNDTQGIHAAWPELWITAKPTPAPMDFFGDLRARPEMDRPNFQQPVWGCGSYPPGLQLQHHRGRVRRPRMHRTFQRVTKR